MRMQHPIRGPHCAHLQCCDLDSFLKISSEQCNTFDWLCPICRSRMHTICYDREVKEVSSVLRVFSTCFPSLILGNDSLSTSAPSPATTFTKARPFSHSQMHFEVRL